MHRRRCTWNAGKVLGVEDLEGCRVRFGEYMRVANINSPRSSIRGVEPIKSRERVSSVIQCPKMRVGKGWPRTEAREESDLLPNVTQAQPETKGSFCADTEIAKDKQNICLALVILHVNPGGD